MMLGDSLDAKNMVVWVDKSTVENEKLNHPKLVDYMVAEANIGGYEPCDMNDEGLPNIYFRGMYIVERDGKPTNEWKSDGYAMHVKPKEAC